MNYRIMRDSFIKGIVSDQTRQAMRFYNGNKSKR